MIRAAPTAAGRGILGSRVPRRAATRLLRIQEPKGPSTTRADKRSRLVAKISILSSFLLGAAPACEGGLLLLDRARWPWIKLTWCLSGQRCDRHAQEFRGALWLSARPMVVRPAKWACICVLQRAAQSLKDFVLRWQWALQAPDGRAIVPL